MTTVVLARSSGAAPAQQATTPQGNLVQAALDKDNVCTECHDPSSPKHTLTIYQTRHGVKGDATAPSCQSCHGDSTVHIKDTKKPTDVVFSEKSPNLSAAEARNTACLTCHDAKARTNWPGSQHESRGVACNSCHNIHAPDQKVLSKTTQAEVCFTCHKTQRAQVHRISAHPLASKSLATAPKMSCSDCHNPHGSTGPHLMAKASVNDTCFACHAEKRGPFLWEHAPVSEDCSLCHTPHGSANAPLLKVRQPVLCQDCHSGDHANQVGSGANLTTGKVTTINGTQQPGARAPRQQLGARACISCHPLVHGSNHPAGAKFSR
ncbi:MAG: DmsE family decaheme c-type cytochrome [Vicinamibacterales bacterium]